MRDRLRRRRREDRRRDESCGFRAVARLAGRCIGARQEIARDRSQPTGDSRGDCSMPRRRRSSRRSTSTTDTPDLARPLRSAWGSPMADAAPVAAASDIPFRPGTRKPRRWEIVRPVPPRGESFGCPSRPARWGARRGLPLAGIGRAGACAQAWYRFPSRRSARAAGSLPAQGRQSFALDPALELHRFVARGPHPAVVLREFRGERSAIAAHALALHRIEDLGAVVVVDVEVHRVVGLPVVVALLARLQLHALLVHGFRLEFRAEGLRAGAVVAMRGGCGGKGECHCAKGASHVAPCYTGFMNRWAAHYDWFFYLTPKAVERI